MFFVSMYLNNASLSEIRIFCIYFNGVKIGRVWSKGCTFFILRPDLQIEQLFLPLNRYLFILSQAEN